MVGIFKYTGHAGQAARLQAARLSAGYSTAREPAQRFGWSEARYRSHEGATRAMSESVLRAYAEAFRVSEAWLKEGVPDAAFRDRGIVVDPIRLRQLELRIAAQGRHPERVESTSAGRLRLARRLAGYRSAASGAAAAGVHRSTLNALERGLSVLDLEAARKYGTLFGCEPGWLLEGRAPSGYPVKIEAKLPQLILDYDLPERQAATRLPSYEPPVRKRAPWLQPRDMAPDISKEADSSADIVPEYEAAVLARLIRFPESRHRAAGLGWKIPRAYIEDVLSANALACVLVAVPQHREVAGISVNPGDRLIIDTSARELFSASYAVYLLNSDVLVVEQGGDDRVKAQLEAIIRRDGPGVLLGEVVGRVESWSR